jgi:hypothetical protein
MATLQTQTCSLKAGTDAGGTSTFTMEEGHWEIIKVDGYLTDEAGVAADITVNRNGVAVSGAMRASDGSLMAAGDPDGMSFVWDSIVHTNLNVAQGDVITVANVLTASVTFVHLRRR